MYRPLGDGGDYLRNTQDADHPLEIVLQRRQPEFSSDLLEPFEEKVSLIIPVFDTAKGMLNDFLTLSHELGGCMAFVMV